jgi:transcriptional regulator with XRE-family HTH domain
MNSAREIFAANLRLTRIAQGVSQERLGEMAGFHRTYVSQVERCVSNVSLDNAQKLADVLGTELWLLLKPSGAS